MLSAADTRGLRHVLGRERHAGRQWPGHDTADGCGWIGQSVLAHPTLILRDQREVFGRNQVSR